MSKPIMPPQKRRRRHFRFPGKDVVVNGGTIDGKLLNVARSGLAIETTFPIRIGQEYRLRVRYEETSFVATGTVQWCMLRRTRRTEHGETVPIYHSGLALQERDLLAQEDLLDKLRQRLLEAPSG